MSNQPELPADVPESVRRTGRYAPATLRAAWWTARSLRRARRRLKAQGLRAEIPPPPRLPSGAIRGVLAVLRRTDPTCLERATVLQTWLAAHGHPFDIVVAVKSEGGTMTAHAWMDGGAEMAGNDCYQQITRIRPPARRSTAAGDA